MIHALRRLTLLIGLGAPVIEPAHTQEPRRSQRAAVMQMIGTTRIEVTYSRPVARGRTLFGGLVPWGRTWNPGADTATAITVSAPILVNGDRLPAGAYSLWAIPGETEWTFIFSRAHPVWHVPFRGPEALRVRAVPQRGAHMETLAFYFPVVDGWKAVLNVHWGETVVPLQIEASPATAP
jgi:Protein of unknown function (DUF2911)